MYLSIFLLVFVVVAAQMLPIRRKNEKENKQNTRNTMISCRWIVLCNAHTECLVPLTLYHIWCDHFAARINDFLQLEILIWNCFDAFVACQVYFLAFNIVQTLNMTIECWGRRRRVKKHTTNQHPVGHKTLNNNLNETSAIDPLIKFCSLHPCALFLLLFLCVSNEPVF